jgi:hypothetical protein
MLYTIAVILLIAWLLGIVGTYTIGALGPSAVGRCHRAVPRWARERPSHAGLAASNPQVSDAEMPLRLPEQFRGHALRLFATTS